MRSLLRSTCLAAGALSLSFALVGCDNGAATTPATTPSSPAPATPGPEASKGGMEGPAAKPADAMPPVEKPKDDMPKDAPK